MADYTRQVQGAYDLIKRKGLLIAVRRYTASTGGTYNPIIDEKVIYEAELNGAVGIGDLALTIQNQTGVFPATGGEIQIDNEQISYTAAAGNVLAGLTRGINGTSPAAHLDLAKVYLIQARDIYSDYSTYAVLTNYEDRHIDGTLIQEGDLKALISPFNLAVVIKVTDKLVVDGIVWNIVRVPKVAPAGMSQVVLYKLQIRS